MNYANNIVQMKWPFTQEVSNFFSSSSQDKIKDKDTVKHVPEAISLSSSLHNDYLKDSLVVLIGTIKLASVVSSMLKGLLGHKSIMFFNLSLSKISGPQIGNHHTRS